MSNTLFIQFYSRIDDINPRFKGHSIYELCNGFSDTYDFCKSKGDFLWVNHSKQLHCYGKNIDKEFDTNLPINSGTIYISAYYLSQLYQAYQWSLKYPNINFIVGGPSANPKIYIVDKNQIPKNFKLIYSSVEDYFGISNFSYPWKLIFPNDNLNLTLTYLYTLTSTCYWGKCIFCNYKDQTKRQRPKIKFEFDNVGYPGKQRINLYSPAMTSNHLKQLFNHLSYDDQKRYDIYLRGSQQESRTLKEIFTNKNNFPQVKFLIGIEFPSKRMLSYMKKNLTTEDILNMVNIIANTGNKSFQIHLSFILGWNNLTPNDINELELFLSKLPYHKVKISFSVNRLFAKPNTVIFDTYDIEKERYLGPFLCGFWPKIKHEQKILSKKAIEVMDSQGVTVFDYNNIRGI